MKQPDKRKYARFIVKPEGWAVLFAQIKHETNKAVMVTLKEALGLYMWLPKQLMKLSKNNNIYFSIPLDFKIEFIKETESNTQPQRIKHVLKDVLTHELVADIVTYEQDSNPTQNIQ